MKRVKIVLSLLLALIGSTIQAQSVTRCYDEVHKKFCVRVDGKLMTIAEYDDWLYKNHPSAYKSDTVLAYWMKRHWAHYTFTESKNDQEFMFDTRTMQWGDKLLTAWVVIDDKGAQCTHWVCAGSDGAWVEHWSLFYADDEYLWLAYEWCADSLCWATGAVDRNGNLFLLVNKNGDEILVPWDWKKAKEMVDN